MVSELRPELQEASSAKEQRRKGSEAGRSLGRLPHQSKNGIVWELKEQVELSESSTSRLGFIHSARGKKLSRRVT